MSKQADPIGHGFRWFGAPLRRLVMSAALTIFTLPAWAGEVVHLTPGDDLADAVESSVPGTVIELAGGNYGDLRLKEIVGRIEAPITIRSADPENPAHLASFDLREVTDLVFDGLVFDYAYTVGEPLNHRPFQVFATRRLVIKNSTFDGDEEPGINGNASPLPSGFALAVRASSDIRLEGNHVQNFARGLIFDDVVDIAVLGNLLEGMRIDGLNFAQVERVEITGNVIRDFRRDPLAGDHADMIQFWTNGTERPSRDILIRGNLLNSGHGWYTQSIFMRNEEVDRGSAGEEMFYQNVTIEDNVIINAHLHGISVGEVDGLTIRYNTLIHNPVSDGAEPRPAMWRPQIRVAPGSLNVTVVGNAAHRLPEISRGENWDLRDNLEIQDQDPARSNHYAALFVAAQTGDPRDLANFAYLPGGHLDGITMGAPMLAPATVAEELGRTDLIPAALLHAKGQDPAELAVPALRITPQAGRADSFDFDAATGAELAGIKPAGEAAAQSYRWDFGDGTEATGPRVSHSYPKPGQYRVTLHLTSATGATAQSRATLTVLSPDILDYAPGSGQITSFAARTVETVRVQDASGAIPLGGGSALVEIPPALIAPLFGSKAFELDLKLRSDSYRNAGEMLRIHPFLIASVSGRGTISVKIATDTRAETELMTRRIDLFSGDWVDLTLRYSDAEGLFQVLVGGQVMGEARVNGPLPPLESWGLAFGNPFNKRTSFKGELGGLRLKVLDNDSRMAR